MIEYANLQVYYSEKRTVFHFERYPKKIGRVMISQLGHIAGAWQHNLYFSSLHVQIGSSDAWLWVTMKPEVNR
jgi:hypothetical protein